jgi:hypothetical protein
MNAPWLKVKLLQMLAKSFRTPKSQPGWLRGELLTKSLRPHRGSSSLDAAGSGQS